MKKLILGLLLLFSTSAYAGQIAVGTISADATTSGFNDAFTTIVNAINGNLEGSSDGGATVSNIKADSIYALNMGDDANPQLRDKELLTNTVDSFSSGTLTQGSFVYSGCTPATSSSLTSDISACVAYVNGYRVSKGATSETYDATMDTYVDISQTGVYTLTAVAIGATQPSVAANSGRIALVTTNGTAVTTVTDLANRRLPGLIIPANYRDGYVVSRDSATTITVLPGTAEVNNLLVPKTTTTTLTIGTAGDWAGGAALNAADTVAFVGLDASGNIKMHTTAPTHANYGVSLTGGKKRYATWSSTVYRILGWFYMSTSSVIDYASNIREAGLSNAIVSNDTSNIIALADTSFTDVQKLSKFYNSGGPIFITSSISGDTATGGVASFSRLQRDGVNVTGPGGADNPQASGDALGLNFSHLDINRPQGTVTYSVQSKVGTAGNTVNIRGRNLVVKEE